MLNRRSFFGFLGAAPLAASAGAISVSETAFRLKLDAMSRRASRRFSAILSKGFSFVDTVDIPEFGSFEIPDVSMDVFLDPEEDVSEGRLEVRRLGYMVEAKD